MTIEEKYPGSYFDHWIVMFSVNNAHWNKDNYITQIALYKEFESDEAFIELQREVQLIKDNNDFILFLPSAREFADIDLQLEDLVEMADTILEDGK